MIRPRDAVLRMAAYHPPTGGRMGKTRLDFNENTVGCSPRVVDFLRRALEPETLSVYPDYEATKGALAAHFRVSPSEFLLTNGTDEAIQVLINTFVDDGDDVLMLKPSYAMYRFYAELAGASIREVAYEPPALAFPMDSLLAAIRPETRVVLISNPNNPTGVGIDLAGLLTIIEAAPDAAILIDEAYFEFSGVTALGLIQKHSNVFVSRTFSKVYGMAAMRIGALFSNAANIAHLHKAQSPYSVNMLAAMAAAEAVRDTDYIASYVSEAHAARQQLCDGLTRMGIAFVPSVANFVLVYAEDRAKELCRVLRDHAILVRDRSYEIPGAVRITTGTREQSQRALAVLERIW